MRAAADQPVFLRIARLSAEALAPGGGVRTDAFLAACNEVLPIVGTWQVASLTFKRNLQSHGRGKVQACCILASQSRRACIYAAVLSQCRPANCPAKGSDLILGLTLSICAIQAEGDHQSNPFT